MDSTRLRIVHPDDFFTDGDNDPWGSPQCEVDRDLLRGLRVAPLSERPDAEVGVSLARLVHDELEKFGTSGGNILNDSTMRESLLALLEVCSRLAVPCDIPSRDLTDVRSWWLRNDAYGSWQARRNLLVEVFGPIHGHLEGLEHELLRSTLATPVSPHVQTGWPSVDTEIHELRRQFLLASTPQDYNGVGLVCVRVLEALSSTVFDPHLHLDAGEDEPPVANTKQRLDRFVERELIGSGNTEIRKLARAAIEVAQAVKHGGTPTRRDAGIAAMRQFFSRMYCGG